MKPWAVVVSDKLDQDLYKKIKKLLQPVFSIRQPAKCLFCDTLTTWAINNEPVCPACDVKYAFMSKDIIPGACEVCGRQGEWCTETEPVRSLCFIHRDAWLQWKIPELTYISRKEDPVAWERVWDEGWRRFLACMKVVG